MNSYMKTDINNFFTELEEHEFSEKNIQNILKKRESKKENVTTIVPISDNKPVIANEKAIKPKSSCKNNIFIPNEKDGLFWCFYLIKNGHLKYELIENKNIITEKQLKISYVEELRKHKQIIKQYKFTTLTNLENNLANEDKININTFLTLCVVENINVIFVKKNTYYELLMNDSPDIFIVYFLNNGKFGFEQNSNKIDNIKLSFFKLDNIEKPIKCITYYKIKDLIDICNKLSIDTINKETNKCKSKKDLYEDIIKTF